MVSKLTVQDHSRIFNGFTYVYPVLSRRSGGISLGINLNINNACNWRCVYCQVDGLVRGKPSMIDLVSFEAELDYMLNLIVNTSFVNDYAPEGLQRFNDISLSGNGEPTLSPQLGQVLVIVEKLKIKYKLDNIKLIVISNGSRVDETLVRTSLAKMSELNGEMWFKIDATNSDDIAKVNQVELSTDSIKKRLAIAVSIIPTKIQTCVFRDKLGKYNISDFAQYWAILQDNAIHIRSVMLYSIARSPALAEGSGLQSATAEYLSSFALYLTNKGLEVDWYV